MSFERRLTAKDRPYRFNPITKRPLCRWCSQDVLPPKKTFCSAKCVHEFRIRSDPQYMRSEVFKRDRGVCSECRFDTQRLRVELNSLTEDERRIRCAALDLPLHRGMERTSSLWDADHVVPVSEGGGQCGLDNIATLCLPCHAVKTRTGAVK